MTAFISGIGETPPERMGTAPVGDLIVKACAEALLDAGVTPADVDGIAIEGHSMPAVFHPEVCQNNLGLHRVRDVRSVSRSGAGVVGAVGAAKEMIEAGSASVVLSYFGVAMGTARRSGTGKGPADHRQGDADIETFERPFAYWPQVLWYAGIASRYMAHYGIDESAFGGWTCANRQNAVSHPYALERSPLDLESYLGTVPVASPLRKADCSLINDGAGALVVVGPDRARDIQRKPVEVLGCALSRLERLGRASLTLGQDLLRTAAAQSGPAAMQAAGVTPSDIDFAEIYDCFSIAAMIQAEEMGLFEPGTSGQAAMAGDTVIGGRIPINTHGGCISNSYTLGIGHLIEAVRQIRGTRGSGQVDGAHLAAVAGYGGWEHATAILGAA